MFPFLASLPRAALREFRAARKIANHIVSSVTAKLYLFTLPPSREISEIFCSGCQKEKAAGNAPEDSTQSGIGPISSKGRCWQLAYS
jgi:hypothetical protein